MKDLFKRITIDIVDKLIDKSSITHHDARQTTRQNTRAGKALVPLTRATNELGDEAAQRRSFVQRIAKLLLLAPLTGARSLANSAEFSQADRASGSATQQEPRFALLICCERYPQNKNLLPAHKNGRDLQRSLQRHGFTVDVEFDTDRSAFLAAINRFRQLLHQVAEDQPKIALIYFFGHGMQQDGINYLLPAGVATDDPQAKEKSVNLQKELLTAFPQRYPGLGVAIIDACRNGDGQEDKAGGFNYFTAPTGCLVAFSASAGQVALSPRDYGRNSFYTAELVQSLDNIKDELPITDLFETTRSRVVKTMSTHEKDIVRRLAQRPHMTVGQSGVFRLGLARSATLPRTAEDSAFERLQTALTPKEVTQMAREFLRAYPNSRYEQQIQNAAEGADEAIRVLSSRFVHLSDSAFRVPNSDALFNEDRQKAMRGDKDAAARIAEMYRLGTNGLEIKPSRSEQWLRFAGLLGNAIACYTLYRQLAERADPDAEFFGPEAKRLGYQPPKALCSTRKFETC